MDVRDAVRGLRTMIERRPAWLLVESALAAGSVAIAQIYVRDYRLFVTHRFDGMLLRCVRCGAATSDLAKRMRGCPRP